MEKKNTNESRSITTFKGDFEAIYGIIGLNRHKYKPSQLCRSKRHKFRKSCSVQDGATIK